MTTTPDARPTPDDVRAAAEILHGAAHRTPVLTSRLTDAELGATVLVKAENLQRTGSFKFRGAFHTLSRLDAGRRRAGVVAYSSGNHAQALALAAQLQEVPATIVMPQDAPASKIAATRGYGARIVHYDRYTEDRAVIAAELADRSGLTLVPPYDHPHVIAGQGTAVLELLEDHGPLDALFVCLGGGGLLSGSLLAVQALSPGCAVFGVEPEASDDGRQSLRAGRIVSIPQPRTIADGAATRHLGDLTFPIIAEHVTDVLTVPDDALITAMALFASRYKVVVEPTGVLAFCGMRAAIAADPERFAGKRIGVTVSGGNVDLDRFASLVGTG
ncbi:MULTISPECIES: threo-3-hydroxy-L-aspartate ammonia-lyase [Pseudonocardia]|uniref:threonine ammonia-lyase n=2 Tax=Pseudonocardia TaxID=1847 RepID=A0A1Y2N6S0_PSEAH|nr:MULTISPECIES: threo-3-hydroxy-L-aspartate ammonia-lyase [Pseudonocardia]OSY42871.1 L-threonine dehydratase catabolic TdcB [Pseudonocardia autotrophica]TDN77449.1 threonine dehydratase [Pseudonocardia autotrophica]BBG01471.1 serine/threonine dehydratase [Pseudonocardia autotrophica]GEC25255.1 serine/threonine dehydratase [Pseudonocardia saturnea]